MDLGAPQMQAKTGTIIRRHIMPTGYSRCDRPGCFPIPVRRRPAQPRNSARPRGPCRPLGVPIPYALHLHPVTFRTNQGSPIGDHRPLHYGMMPQVVTLQRQESVVRAWANRAQSELRRASTQWAVARRGALRTRPMHSLRALGLNGIDANVNQRSRGFDPRDATGSVFQRSRQALQQ